jgi:hypothetical protein
LEKTQKTDLYISLASILISNGIIVYGVLDLNWNFFMVLYTYWFGELFSSMFDKIKYRVLKSRNELPPPVIKEANESQGGRFFFLFIYWVFIVVLVGFVTAPDKSWGDNILVIIFFNKTFNLNLIFLLLGELGLFLRNFILLRNYDPHYVVSENGIMNKRTMIMHISIIAGAFIWFAMNTDKFFFHINAGKYGTYGFMMTFVLIKLIGDAIAFLNKTKKKNYNGRDSSDLMG